MHGAGCPAPRPKYSVRLVKIRLVTLTYLSVANFNILRIIKKICNLQTKHIKNAIKPSLIVANFKVYVHTICDEIFIRFVFIASLNLSS